MIWAAVAAFGLRNWLAIGLAVAAGGLIASLWIGKQLWESRYQRELAAHEQTRAAHMEAVATAALASARADRAERDRELQMQIAADEARKRDEETNAAWTVRVAQLMGEHRARRGELLDHIARLTLYAGPGSARPQPVAACGDLQDRLAVCGQFLARIDDVAERASIRYGEVHNVWAACVRYAKVVSPEGH